MQRLSVPLVVVWLLAMMTLAHPRRVGDASEYVAMAGRLASGLPPAMHATEMQAFTRAWAGTAPDAYELQTRQLAELRGADGRFDLPHPWVYPLVAVPGVWLARATRLSDPWGLVALNLTLVGGLLWMAARRGAGPWTLTVFASPLVWWIDKPISDLFIACLVGASALAWPHPASIAWLGLAAGQNPALGVGAATFTIAAVVAEPARLKSRAWQLGILAGVAFAMLPVAYFLVRLGRFSPLTVWTATTTWPSWASLSFPLTDLNIGVVPRFLPGAVAVGLAMLTPATWRAAGAVPGATAIALLLGVVSQQPSHNTGGSPDFSRYWLWMWPFALPFLLARDARPSLRSRVVGATLLVCGLAWSTIAFRMDRPESYRYPTPFAAWLWRTHPSWSTPLPEAFAERTSHREPALIPTATPGCEKVLLASGAWPASCPPVLDAPAPCLAAGALCYANARGDGTYAFTEAGRQDGTDLQVHDRTWRRADGPSALVARLVGRARAGDEGDVAQVRGVWGVAWRQAWSSAAGRTVIYLRDVREDGRLALRHRGPIHISVSTVGGPARDSRVGPGEAPTMIALPAGPHVLVDITAAGTGVP